MTTADTPVPAPGAPEGLPQPHPLAGAASVLVSGLLGWSWLWVSITVLTTGIGTIPAAGAGLLLLVLWVLAMRLAIRGERARARAVHGIDTVHPTRRVSTRSGAAGWLHGLWLDVASWSFWRGVLHHHLVMVVGLVVVTVFWSLLGAGWITADLAVRDPGLAEILGWEPGRPALVAIAVAALVLALLILLAGVLLERALARFLVPSRDDALREEVSELTAQRRGAVDAAEAERLRIERDLHDGIQPRLVALAMALGMARSKVEEDPAAARHLLDEAHSESKEIITDLRQLARGIHPAVLTDRGLDAALSALAARSAIPVELTTDLPGTLGRESEAVAYFVVSEALTNIAKHSGASRAEVSVSRRGPRLVVRVADDGRGGARLVRDGTATGLAGLTDRVRATGGRLEIASPDGAGTVIAASIPVPEAPATTRAPEEVTA
ncbi:MAG: histidine kinase [Brachybacterium sp.]|nr:histidine kinase [Brachybacterium sp.]